MVQLADGDVKTKEVLSWEGVHLFHFSASSCSQKTRIFLNLKGIDWASHEVLLSAQKNYDSWYLGINPRGLVPTLILDGAVHIESNDILMELDNRFPDKPLIPPAIREEMSGLLHHEDDLHMDLRTITFRFTQARGKVPRSPAVLHQYRNGGSGTVQGKPDANKQREIDFWESVNESGISDEAIRTSAMRFRNALVELNTRLATSPYLLGDALTVLDIAWYVYVNRLTNCGYPIAKHHPKVHQWFEKLDARPEFSGEVVMPDAVRQAINENHQRQAAAGQSFAEVAGL